VVPFSFASSVRMPGALLDLNQKIYFSFDASLICYPRQTETSSSFVPTLSVRKKVPLSQMFSRFRWRITLECAYPYSVPCISTRTPISSSASLNWTRISSAQSTRRTTYQMNLSKSSMMKHPKRSAFYRQLVEVNHCTA